MKSILPLFIFGALAGCAASPPSDVVGPYTGELRRFIVDSMQLPMGRNDFSDDLNGDERVDNQFGNVCGSLAAGNDLSLASADLIATSLIASSVEIQSDDPNLQDDPTVAVRYFGSDGDAPQAMGGRLAGGVFESNRTRYTHVPGTAVVRLALFADADPLEVPLAGVEMDLDSDGNGGFNGTLRGAVRIHDAQAAAVAGMLQMDAAVPAQHLLMEHWIDPNGDGQVTADELANAPVVSNLLFPDIQLFDAAGGFSPSASNQNRDALSLAIRIHLSPCATGNCAAGPVANSCDDRIVDSSETDVDCGGPCAPCAGGARCLVAGDCQTGSCDSGHCREPSCSDGVQNGFESDVDCGGACGPCKRGQGCVGDADCASTDRCLAEDFGMGQCEALPKD